MRSRPFNLKRYGVTSLCAAVRCGAPTVLLALLLAPWIATGQIQVDVEVEHRAYMTGEPFAIRVLLRNQGDTPLVFDDQYHNAEFFVEVVRVSSGALPEAERRRVRRKFVIMPGAAETEFVEITSLFTLKLTGNHRLVAMVRHDGMLYRSRPYVFDLVSGIELLSATRKLPGHHSVDLHYSIRYWSRGGTEQAFLVIEDRAADVIYGTFVLGPLVRVNPPAIRFDDQGRALVAHQSGRNRYTRSVVAVSRDGALLVEQAHHLPDGRPFPGGNPPEGGTHAPERPVSGSGKTR